MPIKQYTFLKPLLFILFTLISTAIILALILIITDYGIVLFLKQPFPKQLHKPLALIFVYVAMYILMVYFVLLLFIPVLINDFLFYYFRFPFFIFWFISFIIFSLLAYYSYHDTIKIVGFKGNIEKTKYSVILVLIGILYPFI